MNSRHGMSTDWIALERYAKRLGINPKSFKPSNFKQFMKESNNFKSAVDFVGFITSLAIRNVKHKETKIELLEQLFLFRVAEKLFKLQKVKKCRMRVVLTCFECEKSLGEVDYSGEIHDVTCNDCLVKDGSES